MELIELYVDVGIVIICSIIVIFVFCFPLFRVLSGLCLVVTYAGVGLNDLMYLYVGRGCRDCDYFFNYMYVYVVLRLS